MSLLSISTPSTTALKALLVVVRNSDLPTVFTRDGSPPAFTKSSLLASTVTLLAPLPQATPCSLKTPFMLKPLLLAMSVSSILLFLVRLTLSATFVRVLLPAFFAMYSLSHRSLLECFPLSLSLLGCWLLAFTSTQESSCGSSPLIFPHSRKNAPTAVRACCGSS